MGTAGPGGSGSGVRSHDLPDGEPWPGASPRIPFPFLSVHFTLRNGMAHEKVTFPGGKGNRDGAGTGEVPARPPNGA